MIKRFLGVLGLYSIVLMILASSYLSGEPLCILSVMNRIYSQNDFTRISEYFTGVEDNGFDTVLRTDDCVRGGIYLVIKLNRCVPQLGRGAYLRFRYLPSGLNKEKEKIFSLDSGCGVSPWVFVGVTGVDACQNLVAWSIEIGSEEGCVVKDSYLWAMR